MFVSGIVTDLCMSPDEKSAACTTNGGVVALWDLEICQCISSVCFTNISERNKKKKKHLKKSQICSLKTFLNLKKKK